MRTLKNIVLVGWLPLAFITLCVAKLGLVETAQMLGTMTACLAVGLLYAFGVGRIGRE